MEILIFSIFLFYSKLLKGFKMYLRYVKIDFSWSKIFRLVSRGSLSWLETPFLDISYKLTHC